MPRLTATLLLLPTLAAAQAVAPRPVDAVRTGAFQYPRLTESSGVAKSSTFPGVLYTINDSGNKPEIFATDSSGRPLGRWLVPGIRNRDWEAISVGPCPAGSCIYLGDTGDNLERKRTVTIYRLTEPRRFERFRGADDPAPLGLDSIAVQYPGGGQDVEALWVDATGSLVLVTKGRSHGVRLFRVEWSGRAGVARVATLVQVLPITPNASLGRWVTDASLAPGGTRVAIRTYTELYLFPVLGAGRLGAPVACNVAGLEPQGEGVTWLDEQRLLLTSEAGDSRRPGPIHVVRCGA